jgi:large subunit ribosomal protein L10
MSKRIKQMEMDALKNTFGGVRDMVLLSVSGLSGTATTQFRANLRKKKVRVQVVKNSLTRRVFGELGLSVPEDSPYWVGPTAVVWGEGTIAEVSRNLEAELKNPKFAATYKDKVKVKGSLADGQPITYQQGLDMPTREEAIGQIVGSLLGAAGSVLAALTGPAAQVASQIQKISEKTEGAAPAA